MNEYYNHLYMNYAVQKVDDFPQLRELLSLGQAPPANVLDLCGGFGRVARLLAQHGFAVDVFDASECLIQLGHAWIESDFPVLHERIRFVVADCADVVGQIEPQQYDLALCAHFAVNEFIESPLPLFENAARGLKSRGILVMQALPRSWRPKDSSLRPTSPRSGSDGGLTVLAASRRIDDEVHRLTTIYVKDDHRDGGRHTRTLERRYWSVEALDRFASRAGFVREASLFGGFHAFRLAT